MQEKENVQGGERDKNKPGGWTAFCEKCGKAFDSNAAVKVPYQEYPGASLSHGEVSPCCGAEYSDRPKEETSQ